MNRINKDAEQRKSEIMLTALQLFVSKGYEKTSTNDIMEALKLSRGGLYHHFQSKEEILDSAVTAVFNMEIEKIRPILDDDSISACNKLKALIEFKLSSQPIINDVKTIMHTKDSPTLIVHLLKIKLKMVTPLFSEIIEQGIKEGLFECSFPEEVSKISVILSTLLFSETFLSMSEEEFRRMVQVFQLASEAMVGAKPGTFNFMYEAIKLGE